MPKSEELLLVDDNTDGIFSDFVGKKMLDFAIRSDNAA